jgi:hypothetical protein
LIVPDALDDGVEVDAAVLDAPAAGVELELLLEPQAAIPTEAAIASASPPIRVLIKMISFARVAWSLRGCPARGVNQM